MSLLTLIDVTHSIIVVAVILTGYASLIAIANISSSKKGKLPVVEEVKPVVVSSSIEGGIPSSDTPEFAAFLDSDAFLQLLENEVQLAKALEA